MIFVHAVGDGGPGRRIESTFSHGHAALLVRGYGFVRNSSFCIRPLSADELN